jgi:hypothetical protein
MNIFMVLDRGRTVHRAVREPGKPSLRTKTIVWICLILILIEFVVLRKGYHGKKYSSALSLLVPMLVELLLCPIEE